MQPARPKFLFNWFTNVHFIIESIKVQYRIWWCSYWHDFSTIFIFKGNSIFVKMNLKFSFFPELLQDCFLLTIVDIEPFNRFEFFENFRFDFYRRYYWFWNAIMTNYIIQLSRRKFVKEDFSMWKLCVSRYHNGTNW